MEKWGIWNSDKEGIFLQKKVKTKQKKERKRKETPNSSFRKKYLALLPQSL